MVFFKYKLFTVWTLVISSIMVCTVLQGIFPWDGDLWSNNGRIMSILMIYILVMVNDYRGHCNIGNIKVKVCMNITEGFRVGCNCCLVNT